MAHWSDNDLSKQERADIERARPKSNPTHSPLPWEVYGDYIFAYDAAIPIPSAHKEWTTVSGGYLYAQAQANMAFIVAAVNMVEKARNLVEEIRERGTHESWKQLAKALPAESDPGRPVPHHGSGP